nr:putative holin-like toxin [Marinilactibacillus piezotolerans]
MSVVDALQLMMVFGMFIIALISLIISINKKDK